MWGLNKMIYVEFLGWKEIMYVEFLTWYPTYSNPWINRNYFCIFFLTWMWDTYFNIWSILPVNFFFLYFTLGRTMISSLHVFFCFGFLCLTFTQSLFLSLQINRESWCTIEPCPDAASLLAPTQSPGKRGFSIFRFAWITTSKMSLFQSHHPTLMQNVGDLSFMSISGISEKSVTWFGFLGLLSISQLKMNM